MEIITGIVTAVGGIFIIAGLSIIPLWLYLLITNPFKDIVAWCMIVGLSLICVLEACGVAALIIKFLEKT